MNKIFKSTNNTRPIIEDSYRFIRSDVPTSVSESERRWLIENGITTIVDLRTNGEIIKKPCPLHTDDRFTYCVRTVTGGAEIPRSVDEVSESYIAMADQRLSETVDYMLNSRAGVLYFCNAGKDRTGVVSAVLLRKLGKDDEYIVTDYMKSKENLRKMLESFAEQNPSVDIRIITPDERYIRGFLNWYK